VYVADYGQQRIDVFSPSGAFIKAWGWGVLDGASHFETCTTVCQLGVPGAGAGQFDDPFGVATDHSGNVYVVDRTNRRVDEFSATGSFVKAYGWGVLDGASQFETCTTACQIGIQGSGAGQLNAGASITTDGAGDVYVGDAGVRIDEFSAAGNFVKAFGYGVLDGASHFEMCTSTCQAGVSASGDGGLSGAYGMSIAGSNNLYVADAGNNRIEEFDPAGNFVLAFGFGVSDGASAYEVCHSSCQAGIPGSGDGQFNTPRGVAVDASGNIYVSDYQNARLEKFSSAAPPPNPTLTVSLSGTGGGSVTGAGISCPGACSHSYPVGTNVTLTATPGSGSTFAGWSGACTGTGACTVKMTANQSVTATFSASGGSGSGSAGGSGGGGTGGTVSVAQVLAELGSEITPTGSAAKIGALLKSGGYVYAFKALEAGQATVSWYQVPSGAHLTRAKAKPKPMLVATGQLSFTTAGTARLRVKLTAAGRKLLKTRRHVRLTAKGTFAPGSLPVVTVKKQFTLQH
jgi:hypothetical protein